MNIDLINASEKSNVINRTKYSSQPSENARIADQLAGYSLDITGKVTENAAYGKENLLSADDIADKAGLVDVSTQRNYMAVMSNSMSDEDFSELLKDGCNPTHTEISESVTNLDKIKAKMAENGNVIDGFNDNLSQADLENALGTVMAGSAIENILAQNDLPATKENVEGVKEALDIAGKILPLSDEASVYMLDNKMEPTISNIYIAEYSSKTNMFSPQDKVIISDGKAYATAKETEAVWDNISSQAAKIIEDAGLKNNPENLENAKWLVENQIPLTGENLKSYIDIKEVVIPQSDENLFKAICVAMEEGKDPKEANLLKTESVYDKAVQLINDFAKADSGDDITKRRQLEEVRLAMSVEANITLLRKGISIDTNNLEGLVEKLKAAEAEFYKPVLGNVSGETDEDTLMNRVDLYKKTTAVVEFVKTAPVQAVGDLIETKAEFNLTNLNNTAVVLSQDYEKAGKSYESLMTAPRSDMGDSITKAFRNVDDILSDLGIALSDDNRKAVRIMGYSQIQITKEAVEQVRIAANTVSNVIEMMTPAKTLQMIREGHNPLTENLYELEKSLKNEGIDESSEKYSEFLVKLERRGEITDEEKSAYIGIYRLFDKIEKKDSRVIGKVLSSGEDLTLKNLLTAYRSGKFGNIDVNINDEFGTLENLVSKGESITEQIERGFFEIQKEETPKEYVEDKLSMINEAASMDQGEKILKELEIPVNVENILAASDFAGIRRKPFEKITSEKDNENKTELNKLRKKSDDIIESFTDRESALEAYEDFVKTVTETSEKGMINSDSYTDIKEWSRLHKQINIAGEMAKRDEYVIPVQTDDGYFSIRLKLNQKSDQEGKVEASFETERYGRVNAMFSMNGKEVSGIVSSQYNGGLQILQNKEEAIKEALRKADFEVGNISFVKTNGKADISIPSGSEVTNTSLFAAARAFLNAVSKGVTIDEN